MFRENSSFYVFWALFALVAATGCGAPRSAPSYVPAVPASPRSVEASRPIETAPGGTTDLDASAKSFDVADQEPSGRYHEVLAGQTLWSIAQEYGSDVGRLRVANEMTEPTLLQIGQRLWIPGTTGLQELSPGSAWMWPLVRGGVQSRYGAPRSGSRTHRGVDIPGRHGEPVLASRDGKVIYSAEGLQGYGKAVVLDHGDGYTSLYAHNSKLLVQHGQHVVAGQPIARVGRTGNATGDHLHFEIRRADRPVDPLPFLSLARRDRR